jgi:hypothetical protein
MDKRAGIGATVGAAVIFSILLASNFSVYYASQENLRLHATFNAEDVLSDSSIALAGAGGTNILLREETFLQSTTLNCSDAYASLSNEVGGLSDLQETANLTVVTTAGVSVGGPAKDNLTMLAPFGGYAPGLLNTVLHNEIRGGESALGVTYAKNETHYAHLPVPIAKMSGICDQATTEIRDLFSAVISPNCTASFVSTVLAAAVKGPASNATASGLYLRLESAVASTTPCSVVVRVSVGQVGIPGPGGEFSAKLQEEEPVEFGA